MKLPIGKIQFRILGILLLSVVIFMLGLMQNADFQSFIQEFDLYKNIAVPTA